MAEVKLPVIYAFIDGNNLKHGVRKDIIDEHGKVTYQGWELDYRKFRLYLRNKYKVEKAYLFIGQVPGNEGLYRMLQEMDYILVFKPTLPRGTGTDQLKGNVDAELVLYASAATYQNYDKAIIVSGDGDFHCLVEYLEVNDKLLHVLAPNQRYSSLLNKFASRIVRIDKLRKQLELKRKKGSKTQKTGLAGRSKP